MAPGLAERENPLACLDQNSEAPAMSRARHRILIGIGALLVAGVLVAWLAVSRSGPKEPVYQGRPLSEWLDGTAHAKGVSLKESNDALRSLGLEAVPWLTWMLEHNEGNNFQRRLFQMRVRWSWSNRKSFLRKFFPNPKVSRNELLRFNGMVYLSDYARGTPYEERTARAVLKSTSHDTNSYFEIMRIESLGCFTNYPALVLPTLFAAITNYRTETASISALANFGQKAIPTVYAMAMAEPGTNGPVAFALARLDTRSWQKMLVEKRGR